MPGRSIIQTVFHPFLCTVRICCKGCGDVHRITYPFTGFTVICIFIDDDRIRGFLIDLDCIGFVHDRFIGIAALAQDRLELIDIGSGRICYDISSCCIWCPVSPHAILLLSYFQCQICCAFRICRTKLHIRRIPCTEGILLLHTAVVINCLHFQNRILFDDVGDFDRRFRTAALLHFNTDDIRTVFRDWEAVAAFILFTLYIDRITADAFYRYGFHLIIRIDTSADLDTQIEGLHRLTDIDQCDRRIICIDLHMHRITLCIMSLDLITDFEYDSMITYRIDRDRITVCLRPFESALGIQLMVDVVVDRLLASIPIFGSIRIVTRITQHRHCPALLEPVLIILTVSDFRLLRRLQIDLYRVFTVGNDILSTIFSFIYSLEFIRVCTRRVEFQILVIYVVCIDVCAVTLPAVAQLRIGIRTGFQHNGTSAPYGWIIAVICTMHDDRCFRFDIADFNLSDLGHLFCIVDDTEVICSILDEFIWILLFAFNCRDRIDHLIAILCLLLQQLDLL